ncbi:MAG: cell division protein ZapA [Bacteroidetes bacterium]|nr:cell division protein ZapA [Bacteroidota bacterium]
MEQEEISIKIIIGDRQYPLKISTSEEENIRKAAKLVNERSKFYTENFSVKDKQDALAMTALEIATENINSDSQNQLLNSELSQQLKDIDNFLCNFEIS